ncbi:MAG TPA: FAD-dependent oxidoreductase, partial [Pseudorhodoferax sp.]|nr:FAD-dependent oxidoreductase [Pseudorhodoferax sp.]
MGRLGAAGPHTGPRLRGVQAGLPAVHGRDRRHRCALRRAMPTVILGGGIVGVTTAYYLAREGEQVVVLDRQPAVARETSFANAGLVAPGHAYTWASPRAP